MPYAPESDIRSIIDTYLAEIVAPKSEPQVYDFKRELRKWEPAANTTAA